MYPDHTHEEIRKAAVDILARRWKPNVPDDFKSPSDYDQLEEAVGNLLNTKEVRYGFSFLSEEFMSPNDRDVFLEVFWDLFREGIISLGKNYKNKEFPHFKISAHGKKLIENKDMYFFHDVSSYESVIKDNIPNIDEVTLLYLKEAMQTFYSGCYLASSVMLGVASEHTLLLLFEKFDNKTSGTSSDKNIKGRTISQKFESFKNKLKQQIGENKITLPYEITENLDDNLDGIMKTIRRFRNDSGHPTGKTISKETCFTNLTLFIIYCKTAYQLIDNFSK